MKDIKLTKKEINFLREHKFFESRLLKQILENTIQVNGGIVVRMSEEDCLKISELCDDYKLSMGFEKNYDLSRAGEILESLQDKFFLDWLRRLGYGSATQLVCSLFTS